MPSSYRLTLENWLKELDIEAKTVLDIGGSQNPVKDRVRSWKVEDYKIADLPNPHEDSQKPDIELDINTTPMVADDYGQYDLIFCLEVFDYVFNPLDAFRHLKTLLAADGTAWVTFPTFYPHHNPVEDDALCYKEYGIRKLASSVNLEVAQMIPRRPRSSALQAYFAAEGLRAARGYDHNAMGFIVELRNHGA